MRSSSMQNLFGGFSPGHPPPDLHRKVSAETSRRSKTDTLPSVIRTFSASKILIQVLGMKDPEPFVPPPPIPSDLTQMFETGLQEYEKLHAAGGFATRPNEPHMIPAPAQQSKATLADILEERERPVRAIPAHQDTTSASNKLSISVPKYTCGRQAVVSAQRYTLMDSDSDAAEDSTIPFPSPGVARLARAPVYKKIAQRYADKYIEVNGATDDEILQLERETIPSPPPRITIQASSPVKSTKLRKRAPSSMNHDELGPPLAQRPRRDDTTGLPVLPLEAANEWTGDFLGNTYALLTVLLTWSHMTWTSYHPLHDPQLFAIHPVFAYPVTPPVRKQLVSVSFYETSLETHKEVRFLGPGDAAEISYHEVDVFANPNSRASPPASPRCSAPVDTVKQTLVLTDKEVSKSSRYMSMPQRAKTGEGRWCYVLIKDHTPPDGSTPPHFMMAWHISAVTFMSDCLHTLYTDDAAPKPTDSTHNKVKRFSSLQNLAQALRSPAKFNFPHSLRTASSSSELKAVDPYASEQQQEGVTFMRTIIKLEKAGGIPLIEGFRIDVKAFREWMEACGRGEGKVILWREKESA
ncbi:hypothetical protein N0V91_005690 [Didymella pomorum]|uniref:Uncharacterized protein n=1 Tax=Didymella pomorum TaxID=749634 RepID=A0A9W8ZE52_9PLEO|nr:hypothetical protein N0V91_005690 [Didymella pomorum]